MRAGCCNGIFAAALTLSPADWDNKSGGGPLLQNESADESHRANTE